MLWTDSQEIISSKSESEQEKYLTAQDKLRTNLRTQTASFQPQYPIYENLVSLTCKIVGSKMQVFTVSFLKGQLHEKVNKHSAGQADNHQLKGKFLINLTETKEAAISQQRLDALPKQLDKPYSQICLYLSHHCSYQTFEGRSELFGICLPT